MKVEKDDVLYHKLFSQVKSMVNDVQGDARATAATTTWLTTRDRA